MSASPRVVITGAGAVCGAGLGVDAIWDAVVRGRSAIKCPMQLFVELTETRSRWPPITTRNAAHSLASFISVEVPWAFT